MMPGSLLAVEAVFWGLFCWVSVIGVVVVVLLVLWDVLDDRRK